MEDFTNKLPDGTPILFIETGTHVGDGVMAAANRLTKVAHFHSVELTEPQYRYCANRFAGSRNITIHHGSSDAFLRNTLPIILKKADVDGNPAALVIWLDAHWSGGNVGDPNNQCPIIEELKAIVPLWSGRKIFLAIDDWEAFNVAGALGSECNASQWPTSAEIRSHVPTDTVTTTDIHSQVIYESQ